MLAGLFVRAEVFHRLAAHANQLVYRGISIHMQSAVGRLPDVNDWQDGLVQQRLAIMNAIATHVGNQTLRLHPRVGSKRFIHELFQHGSVIHISGSDDKRQRHARLGATDKMKLASKEPFLFFARRRLGFRGPAPPIGAGASHPLAARVGVRFNISGIYDQRMP